MLCWQSYSIPAMLCVLLGVYTCVLSGLILIHTQSQAATCGVTTWECIQVVMHFNSVSWALYVTIGHPPPCLNTACISCTHGHPRPDTCISDACIQVDKTNVFMKPKHHACCAGCRSLQRTPTCAITCTCRRSLAAAAPCSACGGATRGRHMMPWWHAHDRSFPTWPSPLT